MHPRSAFARCLLVLAACVRTTPQPAPLVPPSTPTFTVPAGCEALLAGPWVHARDPGYRYQAEDDGGTLTLLAFGAATVDAGFSPRRFRIDAGTDAGLEARPDAGNQWLPSSRVETQRTPSGFVGATVAPLAHPSGRRCEGRFPTTVLSCADGGLLLETQAATALGEECQGPARPLGTTQERHQLLRPPAGGSPEIPISSQRSP